jgi:hypothetical protein
VTVSSQEDNDLPSETDLRARLIALMGGRAAEEILFHEVTGGAANDFEAANRIATSMVTKWGMGRDPEASDGGVSGRGVLSFFVPASGQSLPTEIQPAAIRAIRAILDEAYADASRTLIANLDTLRRLAAYLVEHERVDGPTFDELFDGRLAVPTEGDEWRAAAARPRAWGDVVDLAGHRSRTATRPVAVAATSTGGAAAVAEALIVPDASIMASELVDRSASVVAAADPGSTTGPAQPVVEAIVGDIAAEPTITFALAAPVVAAGALVPASVTTQPGRLTRRLRGRRSASRRARNLAATWLQKAERRLRGSELETDRL